VKESNGGTNLERKLSATQQDLASLEFDPLKATKPAKRKISGSKELAEMVDKQQQQYQQQLLQNQMQYLYMQQQYMANLNRMPNTYGQSVPYAMQPVQQQNTAPPQTPSTSESFEFLKSKAEERDSFDFIQDELKSSLSK